ncbi:hypothetical protein amyaer_3443 [Microcystis aeruginosa NIES-2481]|nr:hypothetical protein amyaer_3443 [Microcystis aeruginosa NIES-2481]
MKRGKTLHPTPYTPHPAPTSNFLPQTLVHTPRIQSSEDRNVREFS